jgi:uncharacterized protein YndB with AHSA1/START domain
MSTFVPIPRVITGRLGSVDDTEALGGRDPREPNESLLQDSDISVSVVVAASAEKVWRFLSDVGRMGAWSQETSRAEWVGGATGPAVGARFRSHGKSWPHRSALIEVEVADPGRSFGFATVAGHHRHTHWMYTLTPCDEGTRVAETRTLPTPPSYAVYAFQRIFKRDGGPFEDGMRNALQRLKAEAEQA